MRLLSFLKRKSEEAAAAPAKPKAGAKASARASSPPQPADSVQQARIRARRRLIGAVVLVVVGVIGFPLLFETQPRPLAVDTPIEIARREPAAQPAPAPVPRPAASRAMPPVPGGVIAETTADAGREVQIPDPPAAVAREGSHKPEAPQSVPEPVESKPVEHKPVPAVPKPAVAAVKPPAKPASAPEKKPAAKPADASRAQALLDGAEAAKKPEAAASGARFIVQVGAFSEMPAARDARQKVEKLGLKTYTQVVETASGNRIRVRVGPFASRADADKAAGKIKSAGLSSAVFTL